MSSQTLIRFSRSCPTCGRRIQVRAGLLGKLVACQHCNAEFIASPIDESTHVVDEAQQLMDRVEMALRRSEHLDEPSSPSITSGSESTTSLSS